MNVREATPDDAEAVKRVARRSWEHDYPAILSRETISETVENWYDPERIVADVRSEDALVAVAEEDGNGVVGFSHAVWDERGGTILRLYVDPDYRGEGRGTTMLERTCGMLFDRGVERIEAMVLAENGPGNEFYRGFGFERVDRNETVIGEESYDENVYALEA